MSVIRRILLFLILLAGGGYLFVEIAADIGGVLWLRHWMAEEELDQDLEFRTGRADPILRNGVIYGVRWEPDFVAEPVTADRVFVQRKSEELIDFKGSRWEFTGQDIDFHLKDEDATVNVAKIFVGVKDSEGIIDFELEGVTAAVDEMEKPLFVRRVAGTIRKQGRPSHYVHLEIDGVRLPEIAQGSPDFSFQGISLSGIHDELERLGYVDPDFDLRFTASYDRRREYLEVEEFSMVGAGLAQIHLALQMRDIPSDVKIRSVGDIGAAAPFSKFVRAGIEIEDFGLIRRIFEQEATDQKLSMDEMAEATAARWPIGPSDRSEVVAFLANPGVLSAELSPNSPVDVFELIGLRKTEAILRRLQLQITNYPK